MNAKDLASLIHLAGFATGAILYAMLGVMTRQRLSNVVAADDGVSADRLPLVASLLGVVWNVGAMLVFAIRDFGGALSMTGVAVLSYSALGFLPAVVVHSTLRRGRREGYRWLLGLAYGASVVALVLHSAAAFQGEAISRLALLLLTIIYVALLGILAITEWKAPSFSRTITAVALAAFAISALHLSRHPGLVVQESWWVEVIGHHASLPLVLAILYQDYRFAFSDLFLKRALALLLLVALVSSSYALLSPWIDPHALAISPRDPGPHLLATGGLLGIWIATAVAYPWIQKRSYRFVDRFVLRRADYRDLRAELARRLSLVADSDEALTLACALLSRAFGAGTTRWGVREGDRTSAGSTISLNERRTVATILVPTAVGPSYEIHVADLPTARTLLSDDLLLVDAISAAVGRRIDELWLDRERTARERQDAELRRLATEAELRALRAQLNPHFLFNALNTLGHLMQAAPDRAQDTLYRLTGLLRAVLRKTDGQFVTLGEDLEIVESYLAIERERFGERLDVMIDVSADVRELRVPPLILQPLVENAVKHGILPRRAGGTVTVRAWRDGDTVGEGRLHLVVADTGQGYDLRAPVGRGVGLANVEKRLQHYYGSAATFAIDSKPGVGTTVTMSVPASSTVGLVEAV